MIIIFNLFIYSYGESNLYKVDNLSEITQVPDAFIDYNGYRIYYYYDHQILSHDEIKKVKSDEQSYYHYNNIDNAFKTSDDYYLAYSFRGIYKLNENKEIIWEYNSQTNFFINYIIKKNDGFYMIAYKYMMDNTDAPSYFIIKLDKQGELVFDKPIPAELWYWYKLDTEIFIMPNKDIVLLKYDKYSKGNITYTRFNESGTQLYSKTIESLIPEKDLVHATLLS